MKRNIDLYDNVLCVCVLWGRGGGGARKMERYLTPDGRPQKRENVIMTKRVWTTFR